MSKIIEFKHRGSFRKAQAFFLRNSRRDYVKVLRRYGEVGVEALSSSTPRDTGKTADSWHYNIVHDENSYRIYWTNSHVNDGVNIAMILQLGHGTGSGAWVEGVDYINPALRSVFRDLANEAWDEVVKP